MEDHVKSWADEALAIVPLVDELPAKLIALSVLPATNDATALLEALLRVRKALKLPSPNTSILPISDKLVQVREDLRTSLAALYESVERGICQCLIHGAEHASVVPASAFQGRLQRLDLDHLVGRQVLLGRLDALPATDRIRQQLPDGGYPDGVGVETVVLGPVTASFPTDPVSLRPGQWFYSDEVVSVTKSWRAAWLAREDQARAEQLRQETERRLAWEASEAGKAAALRQQLARLEGVAK
jgi:hypothetical protein